MRKYTHKKPWWLFWETRLEREIAQYNKGYRYASGHLLGGADIYGFEMQLESYWWFSTRTSFDRGAETAVQDFKKLINYKGTI